MIDCLLTHEFSHFLSLMLDVAVFYPDGSVEIGPALWEFNGNEWCWSKDE